MSWGPHPLEDDPNPILDKGLRHMRPTLLSACLTARQSFLGVPCRVGLIHKYSYYSNFWLC